MTEATDTRRQQAERRREEILEAAVRLFCERGYEGTTIRDIAREIGVAEGLLYHYFSGKAELISECWRRHIWHARAIAVIGEAGDLAVPVVLHRLIREHLEVLYENGAAFRMHAAEMLRNGELAELSQRYNDATRDALAEYLQRHQASGDIRADLDAQIVAGTLLGTIITFFIIHGRMPHERWTSAATHMADHLTRLLMGGLAACPDKADSTGEEQTA